jgi:hypothetical protein
MKRGEIYRAETVQFIRASISGNSALAMKLSSDPIVRKFEAVGDAVVLSFTEGKVTTQPQLKSMEETNGCQPKLTRSSIGLSCSLK